MGGSGPAVRAQLGGGRKSLVRPATSSFREVASVSIALRFIACGGAPDAVTDEPRYLSQYRLHLPMNSDANCFWTCLRLRSEGLRRREAKYRRTHIAGFSVQTRRLGEAKSATDAQRQAYNRT